MSDRTSPGAAVGQAPQPQAVGSPAGTFFGPPPAYWPPPPAMAPPGWGPVPVGPHPGPPQVHTMVPYGYPPGPFAYPPNAVAAAPTGEAAANPAPDQTQGLLNSRFVVGMLVGGAVTYVLTSESVQRALIRGAMQIWLGLQGGWEETKERFRDAESEIRAARGE